MKTKFALLLLMGMFAWAGTASAIPFQVSGSSLDVDLNVGIGSASYNDNSSAVYNLADGQGFDFTFGQISIPSYMFGWGDATLEIDFATPDPAGVVSETGSFIVAGFSFKSFSAMIGSLDFGAPETFEYSYGGASGGLLQIALNDLEGIKLGSSVNLTGRITNLRSPSGSATGVPEPSAVLLLGIGLIGLGLMARKKIAK